LVQDIFSQRVAIIAWLHNVNMSYLIEKIDTINKHNKESLYGRMQNPIAHLENWIRFTINPVNGANEEFQIQFSDPSCDIDIIDTKIAAELLGVTHNKMCEWAKGFLYYKTPVIREGGKYFFNKKELLKWAETSYFHKLKSDYIKNSALYYERRAAAEEERKAERLKKEAKKKARLEKKATGKIEKK